MTALLDYAPAPGADVVICGMCREPRYENGRGVLICGSCDSPAARTREQIEASIYTLKAAHDATPKRNIDLRNDLLDEIERLTDAWLDA